MQSESSVIARKIRSYIHIENQPEPAPELIEDTADDTSLWKTALSVVLMAVIVQLTKTSLVLTRFVRKLEN